MEKFSLSHQWYFSDLLCCERIRSDASMVALRWRLSHQSNVDEPFITELTGELLYRLQTVLYFEGLLRFLEYKRACAEEIVFYPATHPFAIPGESTICTSDIVSYLQHKEGTAPLRWLSLSMVVLCIKFHDEVLLQTIPLDPSISLECPQVQATLLHARIGVLARIIMRNKHFFSKCRQLMYFFSHPLGLATWAAATVHERASLLRLWHIATKHATQDAVTMKQRLEATRSVYERTFEHYFNQRVHADPRYSALQPFLTRRILPSEDLTCQQTTLCKDHVARDHHYNCIRLEQEIMACAHMTAYRAK